MKLNFKARIRNKAFLISFCAVAVEIVYHILSVFGIVPGASEAQLVELTGIIIDALALLGVVVDPTTEGLCDSARAMTYCTECDVRKDEANE